MHACTQVHGDVFRAPARAGLLAVYVGTGSQLLAMTVVTMGFAVLGFLSPANRGGLMTAMLLLFAFMGIVGRLLLGPPLQVLQGVGLQGFWTVSGWKCLTCGCCFLPSWASWPATPPPASTSPSRCGAARLLDCQ